MSQQDIIREGITQRIMKPLDFVNPEETFIPEMTIPRLILEFLHSQGVVIKVEPPFSIGDSINDNRIAVEPLIEGKNEA